MGFNSIQNPFSDKSELDEQLRGREYASNMAFLNMMKDILTGQGASHSPDIELVQLMIRRFRS